MRIGIKIGSALIAKDGDGINDKFILELCRQIASLRQQHHRVFLVSSGAVVSDGCAEHSRALSAAIGQGRLIRKYINCFDMFEVEVAQMLLLAFELKDNQKHIKGLFEEAFLHKVIPVINANDAVNSDELDQLRSFADNDYLFTELCLMLKADCAIFGTMASGLINDAEDGDGEIVRVIDERNYSAALEMANGSSDDGYGNSGMLTKLQCGKRLSENGMRAIIADGRADDFAIKAVNELTRPTGNFGTAFRFTSALPMG
ncbi:MAG: hypothetical protein WCT26_04225 [Candidatus Buchananbacteria bacterium]|jgi:glutamate 5-kinase